MRYEFLGSKTFACLFCELNFFKACFNGVKFFVDASILNY